MLRVFLPVWMLTLVLPAAARQAGPAVQPLRPEMVERIAAAVAAEVKAGRLASKSLMLDLDTARAQGYRVGMAMVAVVPDRHLADPPAGNGPAPLGVILLREGTIGDGRTMLPSARGLRVSVSGPGGGTAEMTAFIAGSLERDGSRLLALYGAGSEPLLTLPLRSGAAGTRPGIVLDPNRPGGPALLFTAGGPLAASLSLGAENVAGQPAPRQGAIQVGDDAPDFTLKDREGKSPVQLSASQGKKPVVLVFGSYT